MKIGLVLTNDWELFGDGSGCMFDLQIAPLSEFLDLSDQYGVKITLMAEVMQQFAFKKYSEHNKEFCKIITGWEEAVRETVLSGSDVQLHIHPQWHNAEYIDGKWILDMSKWSIGKIPHTLSDSLIRHGKKYLEDLIRNVKSDYNCIAFRAGAYCIEPSEQIIMSLLDSELKLDTSVTKGMRNEYFDYRKAHSNYLPWHVSENSVVRAGNSDLIEMPIYADIGFDSPVLKKFAPSLYYKLKYKSELKSEEVSWAKHRDSLKNERYPFENRYYKKYEKRGLAFYLSAILNRKPIQLDYDYMPASAFVSVLKHIYSKYENKIGDRVLPIIASGHFKDIPDCGNIKRIIELADKTLGKKIEYITLTKAYEHSKILLNKE